MTCPRRRSAAFLAGAVLLSFSAGPVSAQTAKLTLDDVTGGPTAARIDYYGRTPNVRWLRSPNLPAPTLLETRSGSGGVSLVRIDARTGQESAFHDPAKMEAALAALPGMTAGDARTLSRRAFPLTADDTRALFTHKNDLFVYDYAAGKASRVTDSPQEAEQNASLAPDGRHVAFVRGNDLWAAPVEWGSTAAVAAPRRLTTDGSADILNGRLDWVYEEEVYGRGNTTGYRWSPDGKRLAFLRLDESPVAPFTVVDHLPARQSVETERYPKAGDPNPVATLGVVEVEGASTPRFLDTRTYPDADRLIVRFGWTPDSARVLLQVQNRTQTFLHLLSGDPKTGAVAPLLKETSPAWVNVLAEPRFLADGTFLWESERTGYRHLYRYKPDGKLVGAVTKGEWDVSGVEGVDEKNGWVYFAANEHSPVAPHAYRVKLDGGEMKRLTERAGSHGTDFDPSFALFLDRWSDATTPTQVRLHDAATGAEVRVLAENQRPAANLATYQLSRPEIVTIPARDGHPLNALVLKPVGFEAGRRYPVFCDVYAGPQSPRVRDSWGTVSLWHQYLAQQGVLVFLCDNRSAGGRGVKGAWASHKNFGAQELKDIEDGLSWLDKQGWGDPARVAISGWSFGGYMVEYALTHSKAFKLGIAGAGVSDWRLYDSIYTERYMGLPSENPEGYKASSPVEAAANLSGKLLLLHGTMDDNVHLQNTVRLIDALERAGKDYELQLYPRSRHGVGDPALSRHMRTRMTRFLLENL